MAKTKVTTHKFYVVDLIRKKPNLQYLEIPKYRVDVQIDVTTKGLLSASEVPSSAMKRLEDAARGALDTYEETIASEAAKLDAKVGKLITEGGEKGIDAANKLIQGANASIKNALDSAEAAAQQAIEARLKKEAQGDSNLKEARARTALKWTAGAISLATSVARLVGTMGADVAAYISIAKDVLDFVIKGIKAKQGDAETARKHYREHTTKTRHKTDSMSTDADKLMKAMKAAKNLKDGVKIGAECMSLKRAVSAMAAKLIAREKFLDEMQALMAGNGLTIDDKTTLQKIRELDKMTIIAEIKEMATLANGVKGLVTALV